MGGVPLTIGISNAWNNENNLNFSHIVISFIGAGSLITVPAIDKWPGERVYRWCSVRAHLSTSP